MQALAPRDFILTANDKRNSVAVTMVRSLNAGGKPCVGISLTVTSPRFQQREERLAYGAWKRHYGSWDGRAWARFLLETLKRMKVKQFSYMSAGYKLSDRARRSMSEEMQAALLALAPAYPDFPLLREAQATDDLDDRRRDFALQFDLRLYQRAAGAGLAIPDKRACPATTFIVVQPGGVSEELWVREGDGTLHKSVPEYLQYRIDSGVLSKSRAEATLGKFPPPPPLEGLEDESERNYPVEALRRCVSMYACLAAVRGGLTKAIDKTTVLDPRWHNIFTSHISMGFDVDEAAEAASVFLLLPLAHARAAALNVGAAPPEQKEGDLLADGAPVSVARMRALEDLISRKKAAGQYNPPGFGGGRGAGGSGAGRKRR